MEPEKPKLVRTSPSLHLLMLVLIFGAVMVGYVAILWSGDIRGYSPSKVVAARDLVLLLPILVAFFWLTRRQRYRGEMILLTAAVLLFAAGQLMQFRLFSDPEYGARGGARAKAREVKAQTVRLLNVETGYDNDKKSFMFGSTNVPKTPGPERPPGSEYSLKDILTSVNTYIPIVGLLMMGGCFWLFKRDESLLWFQRHAMILGVATLIPFALVVLISREGKFLGQTTPW